LATKYTSVVLWAQDRAHAQGEEFLQISPARLEKFNHIFSTFYFWWKNHGGNRYDHFVKSKLITVGQWLQCHLLWMIGFGDQIICWEQINLMNDLRLQDENSDDD
jgi:hypothetical protein